MGLDALTSEEQEIVRRCLQAVVEGPFISEGAFHSMIGLRRAELTRVAERWPCLDEREEDVILALNGSMLALLTWFGWQDEDEEAGAKLLVRWTGTSREEIERIFSKWRGSR